MIVHGCPRDIPLEPSQDLISENISFINISGFHGKYLKVYINILKLHNFLPLYLLISCPTRD